MANIKVLLKDNVEKLGDIGEIVSVKPGYARNYLIPKGFASLPTPGEVKMIQRKKELLEKAYKEEKQKAEEVAKKITDLGELIIFAKAGEAGKLFGSITAKDVAEELNNKLGLEIQRKQVLLKRSIAELGELEIKLKLHNEVTAQIKLSVRKHEEG